MYDNIKENTKSNTNMSNNNKSLINLKRENNNSNCDNLIMMNERNSSSPSLHQIQPQKNLNLPVLPISLCGVSAVPPSNLSATNLLNNNYHDLNNKPFVSLSSNHQDSLSYDVNSQKYKSNKLNYPKGPGNANNINNALSNIPIVKNPFVTALNANKNIDFNLNEEIFELQTTTNSSNKTRLQLSNNSLSNLALPLNNNSSFNNLSNLDSSISNDSKKLRAPNLSKNKTESSSKENYNLLSNLNKSSSQTKMATLPAAPIILNTKTLLIDNNKPPLPVSIQSSLRSKSSTPVNQNHDSSNVPLPDQEKTNNLDTSRMNIINSFNRHNSTATNFTSSTLTLTTSNKIKPNMNIDDSLATLNLYQNSSYNLVNNDFDLDESSLLTSKSIVTNSENNLKSNSNSSIVNKINDKQKIDLTKEEKDKRLKDLDIISTIGTGTFGRVTLVKNQVTKDYFALKMMSIYDVFRLKQIEHVKNEKNILELVNNHPFLVKIIWTHHDSQYLYMLLEYVPGGELFSLLRQRIKFETKAAIFYSAEIVCALEYLHSMQIAYRDLKPENILLDLEGHLKLTDFGFAKIVTNKTYTLCGTPEYLAPEVILNRGHDMCCDWWTLGIIIFEFLSGSPPFYDENQYKVYEKILAGNNKIDWPRHFDSAAKDIIKKLLVADPTKRLGSGNCGIIQQTPASYDLNSSETTEQNGSIFLTENENQGVNESSTIVTNTAKTNLKSYTGEMTPLTLLRKKMIIPSILNHMKKTKSTVGAEEIKKHRWFVSITNWNDVLERRLKPPFKPEIMYDGDTRNFEKYDTPDLYKVPCANDKQLDLFLNF